LINREVVTVVTGYYGKLIMDAKSLILLQLTNLPRLTPYRGYRGVVSNPPPPPIFFLASNTINCSVWTLCSRVLHDYEGGTFTP
jgi:hypothetical protein